MCDAPVSMAEMCWPSERSRPGLTGTSMLLMLIFSSLTDQAPVWSRLVVLGELGRASAASHNEGRDHLPGELENVFIFNVQVLVLLVNLTQGQHAQLDGGITQAWRAQ